MDSLHNNVLLPFYTCHNKYYKSDLVDSINAAHPARGQLFRLTNYDMLADLRDAVEQATRRVFYEGS